MFGLQKNISRFFFLKQESGRKTADETKDGPEVAAVAEEEVEEEEEPEMEIDDDETIVENEEIPATGKFRFLNR